MSPPEVAEIWGVDVAKVLAWIKSGELVASNLAERQGRRPRFRVSPAEMEAFARRRQVQPPQPRRQAKRKAFDDVPSYV